MTQATTEIQTMTPNIFTETARCRVTLCLARRLDAAAQSAEIIWARLKRDITCLDTMGDYVRELQRCQRLKSALQRRSA